MKKEREMFSLCSSSAKNGLIHNKFYEVHGVVFMLLGNDFLFSFLCAS